MALGVEGVGGGAIDFGSCDVLSLDAGNTIIFLDHGRLQGLARALGYELELAALVEAEGVAKRAAGTPEACVPHWSAIDAPGARGWGEAIGGTFRAAGVPERALPDLLANAWASHRELNLYSLVPDDLPPALAELRKAGAKVIVVSNSEAALESLFDRLGITQHFDFIADSGKLGVEKPDPRIFQLALERCGGSAARAVHVGDTVATDVDGARRAGLHALLIDPHGHYRDLHPEIERVPSAAYVARAMTQLRTLERSPAVHRGSPP